MSKKKKQLVYIKSNDLIQMRGTVIRRDPLSETKRKIIALEASKVQESDTKDTVYTITALEMLDLCSVEKNGRTYEQIFAEMYDLKTKAIAFVNERGKISIESYMDNIEIDRENGNATFTIPAALMPHFKSYARFTRLDLIEYMPLRGQYALLLYELLMSWREKGEVYYTLDQLRLLLEVPEETYPRNADFLRYVIYQPLTQINDRLQGMKVKHKLKYGYRRKVEGVTFIIPKPKETPKSYEEEMEIRGQAPLPFAEIKAAQEEQAATVPKVSIQDVNALTRYHIPQAEAVKLLETYGAAYIHAKIDLMLDAQARNPKSVQNPPAWLRKAIAEDWKPSVIPGSEAAKVADRERPKTPKTPKADCPKCHGEGHFHEVPGDITTAVVLCSCKTE